MRKQIFVFGHYGQRNVGDDAMIYSLLNEFIDPSFLFNISVLSPIELIIPDKAKQYARFVPRKVIPLFSEISRSNCFIMGGGTQLYDTGYSLIRIKILVQILIILMWARIYSIKIYFINIGVETPSSKLGRYIIGLILKQADYISVRDTESYELLRQFNLKNEVVSSFDLAVLLPYIFNDVKLKNIKINILGISVLPFFKIYHGCNMNDNIMVQEIADELNKWLENDSLRIIHLFIFKGFLGSAFNDESISKFLIELLKDKKRVKLIPYNPDPLIILSNISRCDAFIGMRYHSCVFSYLASKPMLVIDYFEKCRSFAEDIGLPKKAIISPQEIIHKNFGICLRELTDNPEDFIAKLSIEDAKKESRKGLFINQIRECI